jgi:hypothetical protein
MFVEHLVLDQKSERRGVRQETMRIRSTDEQLGQIDKLLFDNIMDDTSHSRSQSTEVVRANNLSLPKLPDDDEKIEVPTIPMSVRHVHTVFEYPYADTSDSTSSIPIQLSSADLIEDHLQRIRKQIESHTIASAHYEKWNRRIGYPIAIISGFLASTLMVGFNSDETSPLLRALNLALSLSLFFLSATQNYLKYDKLSQSHDTSSKLYTTLLRGIEIRLVAEEIESSEKRDIFKDILEQMSIIEQFERTIPDWIKKKVDRSVISRSMAVNMALMNDADLRAVVRSASRGLPPAKCLHHR